MNLHQCFLTQNACYKAGVKMIPKGIMVHSTGANNPWLKRYVAPNDGLLGENTGGTHWNTNKPGGRFVCVHAFIGKLADGSIAAYQTLPWTMRGWHSGKGSQGSANNMGYIGFEICEDNLTDAKYFNKVYLEAVELCAMLCKKFNLNPRTQIICHCEGCKKGIASNHGDVMHWFPRFGKSMDTFRADVAKAMKGEEEDMTKEEVKKIVTETLKEQETEWNTVTEVPDWGRSTVDKLVKRGVLKGTGSGLGLTPDLLRVLVINDRAGVYGK